MSKYYYLVAGLPELTLEDSKLSYTVADFKTEIYPGLSSSDQKLIDLFFLKFDNKNLIAHVKQPDRDPDPRGHITYDEFNALYKALKEEEKPPKNDRIPPYFKDFFKLYLENEGKENKQEIPWEDRLATLYYA